MTYLSSSSPQNSPLQSVIVEGFVEASSCLINKIIVYKQEISLARAREMHVMCYKKSDLLYIFGSLFIPFSSFMWQFNKLCFHIVYHCIGRILWYLILKQLLFCFILLPFFHLLVPKKNKICGIKQKLYIYLKFFFGLLSIVLSYLSLLLNSNKASKIIFKTIICHVHDTDRDICCYK